MSLETLSHNLLLLRRTRGWSQDRLAREAGISRLAYVNIERQLSEPRAQTVRALANALEVKVPDLLAPAFALKHVRFRSLKRLKGREQVLVDVGRKLRDFVELEQLLGEHQTTGFDELSKLATKEKRHGMPHLASVVRKHFGLSDREPVHDICGLLEHAGVKVLSVSMATDAFLGLSVAQEDGGPAVVVNTWHRLPVEYWIFSAAHELGHLLLHLQAYHVDQQGHDSDEEHEADSFASHFLMPESVFRREWGDSIGLPLFDRVLKVKRVFRVSWRTVLYRLTESMPNADQRKQLWRQFVTDYQSRNRKVQLTMDGPDGVGVQVYGALSQWHKVGPEPAAMDAHDFQGDRLWRLVRQATLARQISMSRAAEILGLELMDMRRLVQSWMS